MEDHKLEIEYPNITLKVANQTPAIQLQTDESSQRDIYRMDRGLDTFLMQAAEMLGMENVESEAQLYELIRNSDETAVEFPEGRHDGDSKLSFDYLLRELPTKINSQEFPPETTEAVKAQMMEFIQGDVLAGLLEEVYTQLIKQMLEAAQTMEIPTFVLQDERLEPRLREKLAKELAAANIELTVI